MPVKQSSEGQLVAEVAVLLGAKQGASPDGVTRDSLAALTQRQLVSASKKLGLVAVSKLKKDELAVQVWAAWRALLATPAAAEAEADGVLAAAVSAPEARPAPQADGTLDGHNGRAAPAVSSPVPPVVAADSATAASSETVPPRSHKFEVGPAD